jgi:PIN domain nuclease of toxin-antitoxin system
VGREPVILLDTHALVWWVADAARLSARAKRAIRSALREGHVAASAISLFEIATAIRRGRLVLAVPPEQWIADLRLLPELHFEPVSAQVAEVAGSFDEAVPGDPADRIIAATAIALGLTLVTADKQLRRAPRLQTVW